MTHSDHIAAAAARDTPARLQHQQHPHTPTPHYRLPHTQAIHDEQLRWQELHALRVDVLSPVGVRRRVCVSAKVRSANGIIAGSEGVRAVCAQGVARAGCPQGPLHHLCGGLEVVCLRHVPGARRVAYVRSCAPVVITGRADPNRCRAPRLRRRRPMPRSARRAERSRSSTSRGRPS